METAITVYTTVAFCCMVFVVLCQCADPYFRRMDRTGKLCVVLLLVVASATWPVSGPYIWYTEIRK